VLARLFSRLKREATYLILLAAKAFSKAFFRPEVEWIGGLPPDPWDGVRLVAIINHTSLYEWLFTSIPPNRLLRQMALHGVLPSADKTMRRPFVGTFFHFLAGRVIPVTRERDQTWEEVLVSIRPESVVIIAPEGRMKRANGLDLFGRPMTIRGGIADILQILGRGRMLIGYSQGLHHVQIPGQWLPKLFKTIRISVERLEIEEYLQAFGIPPGSPELKRAVKADLQARRDAYCPEDESTRSRLPVLRQGSC
jgi:hypothetical protein